MQDPSEWFAGLPAGHRGAQPCHCHTNAVMLPHVSSAAGLPAPGVWPHHHPPELAVGSLQPALYAVREGWWGRGTCQAVSHAEEEVLESLSSTALAWPYLHMLSSAKWLLCCSGSERGTLLNQAHSLLPRCKTDIHLDLGSLWHTCWVVPPPLALLENASKGQTTRLSIFGLRHTFQKGIRSWAQNRKTKNTSLCRCFAFSPQTFYLVRGLWLTS